MRTREEIKRKIEQYEGIGVLSGPDRLILELLLDIRDELGRLNSNVIDVENAVDRARPNR